MKAGLLRRMSPLAVAMGNGSTYSISVTPGRLTPSSEIAWKLVPESTSQGGPTGLNSDAVELTTLSRFYWSPNRKPLGRAWAS